VDNWSPRTSHVSGQADARAGGFELAGAWTTSLWASNFSNCPILFRQIQNRNYFLVSFRLQLPVLLSLVARRTLLFWI
jgi:hypothetical protein